jgi:hypothetical protein
LGMLRLKYGGPITNLYSLLNIKMTVTEKKSICHIRYLLQAVRIPLIYSIICHFLKHKHKL